MTELGKDPLAKKHSKSKNPNQITQFYVGGLIANVTNRPWSNKASRTRGATS